MLAKMKSLFITVRVLGVWLGLASLLGVLWFYGELPRETVYFGNLTGGALVVAASLPRRIMSRIIFRGLGIVICLSGIVAQGILIQNHLNSFSQPERVKLFFEGFIIFALAVMAIEFALLKHFSKPREPEI
jgi:hypothetical protein